MKDSFSFLLALFAFSGISKATTSQDPSLTQIEQIQVTLSSEQVQALLNGGFLTENNRIRPLVNDKRPIVGGGELTEFDTHEVYDNSEPMIFASNGWSEKGD